MLFDERRRPGSETIDTVSGRAPAARRIVHSLRGAETGIIGLETGIGHGDWTQGLDGAAPEPRRRAVDESEP